MKTLDDVLEAEIKERIEAARQRRHLWQERHSWTWMAKWPMFRRDPRKKCIRCGAMLREEQAGRRRGRVLFYKPTAGTPWQSITHMPQCPGRSRARA